MPKQSSAACGALDCRQRGYSLIELLVVAGIVSVLAAVALPELRSSENERLDLAASRVGAAIQFARAEAMRTGEAHGVTISQVAQTVTAVKWDLSTDPATALYTLTDPLSKQAYDFNINVTTSTAGVQIANTQDAFSFTGLGRRRSVMFDANGTPMWTVTAGPSTYALSDADVLLNLGDQQRRVTISPLVGRVTIE